MAIAIAAASALPEKLPSARAGRRGRQRFRSGRQEAAPANLYSVPAETEEEASADTGYGAPSDYDDAQAAYGAPPVEEEADEAAEYDELPANDVGTGYGAPEEGDGSGDALAPPADYDDQASYASDEQATYSDADSASADAAADDAAADPLAMLMKSVPGVPGEDYPIFAEAPETAFSCEGQVNGGKIVKI